MSPVERTAACQNPVESNLNQPEPVFDAIDQSLESAHDWVFPVPIAYGPGRLRELGQFVAQRSIGNPLLVTDRGSFDMPFISSARECLAVAGIQASVFADIAPNPTEADIHRAAEVYRAGRHDAVIAIGGGSGMDAGKATALIANHECDLWGFDYERESPALAADHSFPPLICIPTTAGTGAETESTAMVTDTRRGMKLGLWQPGLKPALALLDPELTRSLPADLTAWTGIDALVHAIEAFCVPDGDPVYDRAALQAMSLIARWLPMAVEQPDSLQARGGMQVGACLAGIAFLKGLGLVHAISHMVGAEYNTHHGLTNAVLLPAVLRFNAPNITDRLGPMSVALGLDDDDFETFYGYVCDLLDRLRVPTQLSALGVTEGRVPELANKVLKDTAARTNPRVVDCGAVCDVMTHAISVGREQSQV